MCVLFIFDGVIMDRQHLVFAVSNTSPCLHILACNNGALWDMHNSSKVTFDLSFHLQVVRCNISIFGFKTRCNSVGNWSMHPVQEHIDTLRINCLLRIKAN